MARTDGVSPFVSEIIGLVYFDVSVDGVEYLLKLGSDIRI